MDPQTRRYQEAVEWLFCLQEDCPTNQQIIEWVEWCAADAENRRAFALLMPAWVGLEAFRDDPESAALLIAERLIGSRRQTEPDLAPVVLRQSSGGRLASFVGSHRIVSWLALAAGVVLAVGIGFFWQAGRSTTLAPVATLASSVGQSREANLPDGSHLDLGARSELAINFQGARRQIELKDGEAFFAVTHDTNHPFVVQAGALQVVAVGTAFDVLRSGDRVIVTVGEGVVEVTAQNLIAADGFDTGGAPNRLRVSKGSQIVFDAASPRTPVLRVVDPQSAGVWRKDRFEYIDEPLFSVIANLNRYSQHPISIRDEDVGHLTFTGTIALHSIDEWLQALPRIFPVRVAYGSDDSVAIQARAAD